MMAPAPTSHITNQARKRRKLPSCIPFCLSFVQPTTAPFTSASEIVTTTPTMLMPEGRGEGGGERSSARWGTCRDPLANDAAEAGVGQLVLAFVTVPTGQHAPVAMSAPIPIRKCARGFRTELTCAGKRRTNPQHHTASPSPFEICSAQCVAFRIRHVRPRIMFGHRIRHVRPRIMFLVSCSASVRAALSV